MGLLVAPGASAHLAFVLTQGGWLQVDVAKGQVTPLPASPLPLEFQVPWPTASGALSMASPSPVIYFENNTNTYDGLTSNALMIAIRVTDGALVWTTPSPNNNTQMFIYHVINEDTGVVFGISRTGPGVTGGDYWLQAVAASNGTMLWSRAVTHGSIMAPVLTSDGLVIIYGTFLHMALGVYEVQGFDQATGALMWTAQPSACWGDSPMVVDAAGVLYSSVSCESVFDDGDSAALFALNTTTGTVLWSLEPNKTSDLDFTSVVIAGKGRLLVTQNQYLVMMG